MIYTVALLLFVLFALVCFLLGYLAD